MPEGTQREPGDEPERPASYPTEPLGAGSSPTEPIPPPGPPPEPPPWASPPPGQQGEQPPWASPPPGQPPGQGPHGPYGQYGYPVAPRTESSATAALVIAVVGFFVCFPVAGVVALILALTAERRIKESGGRLTGLDQARIAKIIAIVELALVALGVILLALLLAFAGQSSTASGLTSLAPLR